MQLKPVAVILRTISPVDCVRDSVLTTSEHPLTDLASSAHCGWSACEWGCFRTKRRMTLPTAITVRLGTANGANLGPNRYTDCGRRPETLRSSV